MRYTMGSFIGALPNNSQRLPSINGVSSSSTNYRYQTYASKKSQSHHKEVKRPLLLFLGVDGGGGKSARHYIYFPTNPSVIIPKTLIGTVEGSFWYLCLYVTGEVGFSLTAECLCASAEMRMCWMVFLQTHFCVPLLLKQWYSIVLKVISFFPKASLSLCLCLFLNTSSSLSLCLFLRKYRNLFTFSR